MSGAKDISVLSLGICYLMLAIVFFVLSYSGTKLGKRLIISVARMTGQLFLMGFFLEYLFKLDNGIVNISWIIIMSAFASSSIIQSSELKLKFYFIPVFGAALISTVVVLLYYITLVVRVDIALMARYSIPIAVCFWVIPCGVFIVLLNNFYSAIRKDELRYHTPFPVVRAGRRQLMGFFRTAFGLHLLRQLLLLLQWGLFRFRA
jgi:putative ABC transport system permease protein